MRRHHRLWLVHEAAADLPWVDKDACGNKNVRTLGAMQGAMLGAMLGI